MAARIPLLHLCQEQEGYVGDEIMHIRRDTPRPLGGAREGRRHLLHALQPAARSASTRSGSAARCPARSAARTTSSQHCEKRLGIHAGETTPDGKVTLRTAECLASCGTAPMMQVDKDYYENLTRERVDEILDEAQREPRLEQLKATR